MVFQKPYLNIACKRSAQRAIPWWEHTKLSIKLIRVILRQPKESKKGKKKKINPCPAQFCKSRCLWYEQASVCSPGSQGESSWGKPHTPPMWKVGGGHSVAILRSTSHWGGGWPCQQKDHQEANTWILLLLLTASFYIFLQKQNYLFGKGRSM